MSSKPTSRYPAYDVLAKRDSPSWNEQTRQVIYRRLSETPPRRFFTPAEWETLTAACERLLPQPDRAQPIPIAPWIDEQLHAGRGGGCRYADMPPAPEAWRRGLAALDAEARAIGARTFGDLDTAQQDDLLARIQVGRANTRDWGELKPDKFFSQVLLHEAVAVYYAHPDAWNEIGFGGPASPRGYVRLGFDMRDPWEAERADGT